MCKADRTFAIVRMAPDDVVRILDEAIFNANANTMYRVFLTGQSEEAVIKIAQNMGAVMDHCFSECLDPMYMGFLNETQSFNPIGHFTNRHDAQNHLDLQDDDYSDLITPQDMRQFLRFARELT